MPKRRSVAAAVSTGNPIGRGFEVAKHCGVTEDERGEPNLGEWEPGRRMDPPLGRLAGLETVDQDEGDGAAGWRVLVTSLTNIVAGVHRRYADGACVGGKGALTIPRASARDRRVTLERRESHSPEP